MSILRTDTGNQAGVDGKEPNHEDDDQHSHSDR